MADKYDSYLTILHQLRQIKGALRQSSYETVLKNLQLKLSNTIGEPHPYRLVVNNVIDQLSPLLSVPEFKVGALGSDATPRTDYVYHLTSVGKIRGNSTSVPPALTWTYLPPSFPNINGPDRKLFETLLDKYSSVSGGGGWLRLQDYAKGKYSGKRHFTWWTNLKLLAAHIVCAAHRLGLPNKWIPKYAIIMRCPTKEVIAKNLAHVPTVLDGFVSEIFSPADYRTVTPTQGETINLDSPRLLATGADEYALAPIDVEPIEFYPVLIDRLKRSTHVINRDAQLWQLLEVYYDNL